MVGDSAPHRKNLNTNFCSPGSIVEHGGESQNGIAFARSKDLQSWTPAGFTTLGQDEWDWAEDRITAGFAIEAPGWTGRKYLLFFHGSRKVCPETHGNASLGLVLTDDFQTFHEI